MGIGISEPKPLIRDEWHWVVKGEEMAELMRRIQKQDANGAVSQPFSIS